MNDRERKVIKFQLNKEQAVLDDLERQYKRALRDIDEKIKLLQSDELTQSKIYQIQYQKALRGQVEGILDKLQGDEYATIQQYLHDCYQDGFIGTAYSLHGQGIPLIMPLNQDAAVKAVITDSQISEGLYNHLGVNIKQMKQAIRQEITRGIASNMLYADIARNIVNRTKAPIARAKAVVRTEGHRIQEASAEDARQAAKAMGCDSVKQWNSTLDGDTRSTHRQLDGQIVELHEQFTLGSKKARFPGDFGDPKEDCECRCRALTRPRWALDEEELKVLKERAKFFELDKAKDFEAFEKKYLKASVSADNPFVIAEQLPPHYMDFTNDQDYRKAVESYKGSMSVHQTYFTNEEWGNFSWDDDERIGQKDRAKRISATVKKLNDNYPLHSKRGDLHIGEFETVQYRLTDIQRSRLDEMAQAQTWPLPDKDSTVMGFNLNGYTGTLADDLQIRADALSAHKRLHAIFDNSPEGVAIHEYGHAMSEWINQEFIAGNDDAQDYWKWYQSLSKDDIKDGLSIYAATNRYEFEAECFAELLTGNPRPIAKKYGEYLEKISGGQISFHKSSGKKAQKTLKNQGKNGIIKLGNKEVRTWYIDQVRSIPDSIDQGLPMAEKARLAFEERNRIRTEARNLMADEATREMLDREKPNKTFEELVKSKMERKGMTRDEAIEDVYKTATKTNANVNRELGMEDD